MNLARPEVAPCGAPIFILCVSACAPAQYRAIPSGPGEPGGLPQAPVKCSARPSDPVTHVHRRWAPASLLGMFITPG